MPYCCKDYREYLSVRKGVVMESSKLDFRQSSLWHMLQRIREVYDLAMPKLTGTERNGHDPKQTGSLLMQGKVTAMDAKQRNDDSSPVRSARNTERRFLDFMQDNIEQGETKT